MSTLKQKTGAARRIARTRAKISGTPERPRMAVKRSLRHVYVQLIDDTTGKTIVAASDIELSEKQQKENGKSDIAKLVGKLVAERAKEKGIERAVFDRRDKRYHGRVRAVAEGAREGGLEF